MATLGDAVRYPDALVTCTTFRDTVHSLFGVLVTFEMLSPILGTSIGLAVLERSAGDKKWIASALTDGDTFLLPEIGIETPVTELYEKRRSACRGGRHRRRRRTAGRQRFGVAAAT